MRSILTKRDFADLSADLVARTSRQWTNAIYALAVLVEIDKGADRIDLGDTICVAIASDNEVVTRHSRMLGGRDWVRWKWRLTACGALCTGFL